MIGAVTVYCSSSKRIAREYLHAAGELGEAVARQAGVDVDGDGRVGVGA